jgi:hypothetical protein
MCKPGQPCGSKAAATLKTESASKGSNSASADAPFDIKKLTDKQKREIAKEYVDDLLETDTSFVDLTDDTSMSSKEELSDTLQTMIVSRVARAAVRAYGDDFDENKHKVEVVIGGSDITVKIVTTIDDTFNIPGDEQDLHNLEDSVYDFIRDTHQQSN